MILWKFFILGFGLFSNEGYDHYLYSLILASNFLFVCLAHSLSRFWEFYVQYRIHFLLKFIDLSNIKCFIYFPLSICPRIIMLLPRGNGIQPVISISFLNSLGPFPDSAIIQLYFAFQGLINVTVITVEVKFSCKLFLV